jgi:hypothetical protein
MKLNRGLLSAVLIASATLTACASRPYAYYRVPPPPPPPYGGYRAAPGPGYVYTEGFYDLRGGSNWVWVSGRYVRPPHPRAVWVAPRWEQHERGWIFHRGYWR